MKHGITKLAGILVNYPFIKSKMFEICAKHNLNVLSHTDHTFYPVGYTLCILLSESHFTIHTWPEENYCMVDLFTCNPDHNVKQILNDLADLINCEVVSQSVLERT